MRICAALVAFFVLVPSIPGQDAGPVTFRLTVPESKLDKPFSGRVYVVLTRFDPRTITRSLNWFAPEPVYTVDVSAWKPGTPLQVGATASAFPKKLTELNNGAYYAQAIIDRDLGGISCFASPGNLYSRARRFELDPDKPQVVDLTLDQVAEDPAFRETANVKLVDIPSPMLTEFHKKPMRMRAGVVLPASYGKEPDKKYPIVYEITGFGGDHTHAGRVAGRQGTNVAGEEVIWVVLDGNCRLGHHVFADSANNGPVGTAFVKELIPHIESQYRAEGSPKTRFVTGHSSGGWSSLWLQIAYPDTFGGCWSTSPDPVDFRDFQRVNIYEPGANLFKDSGGQIRDLSRGDRGSTLTFRGFSAMEDAMGRGGQLGSFEAVFSPKGADGRPRKLWDRATGAIDPEVAKSWEAYDIRLKLEREWKAIGPKLAGKIHVWMGDVDTFYLDGAARLFKESLTGLKSDAVVEMFPNKTHALVDRTLRTRMNEEMAAAIRKARQ